MKNQYKINKNKLVYQKDKNLRNNNHNKIQNLLKGLKISKL